MKIKSLLFKISILLIIFICLLSVNVNNTKILHSSKKDHQPSLAASGKYTENFTTTTYMDPLSNVSGWGSGEISIPRKNLTLIGSVDNGGDWYGLDVIGDYAYIGVTSTSPGALRVINVSNPQEPEIIFTLGITGAQADGLFIVGDLLYLADGINGFRIINISDPVNPDLIKLYDYSGVYSMMASDVFVSGNYAYVTDRASFEFVVIDISDPTNPFIVGDTLIGGAGLSVYVSGNFAYVGHGGGDLRIVDISTPSNPTPRGTFSTSGSGEDVFVSGNLAYFAAGFGGFRILDISNPDLPSQISSYFVSDKANGVYLSGDLAFLAYGDSGLQVINISDPANPTPAGFYDDDVIHAEKVVVSGDSIFLLSQDNGLFIINTSLINQFETSATAQSTTIYEGLSSESLMSANLTVNQSIQSGTSISYYLSSDNGLHWESVTPGLEHQFAYIGNQLKWMSVLNGDSTKTPTIDSLNITYKIVLEAPSLISPVNNTTTNNAKPTFEWSNVSGAYNYEFLLDTSEFFTSLNLINVTTSFTTYTPSTDLSDGTWYWCVRANDSEGVFGFYSPIRVIIVDTIPPVAPSLLTPLNNSFSFDSTPIFTWSSVADADSYTLQVDLSNSFDSVALVSVSGIPNNTYTLISPLSENPWFWRVCAFDVASNQGNYSNIYIFVIDYSPPLISDEENISYEEGTVGHSITWYGTDNNPDSYVLKRNGVVLANPPWDGSDITINIDDLSIGTYTYNCTVYDKVGNSAYDIVVVTVVAPDEGEGAPAIPFEFIFLLFALIAVISIILMEKRKMIVSD